MAASKGAVLVVGGAGGIGRAVAAAAAGDGYAVTVWDVRANDEADCAIADWQTVDMADPDSAERAIAVLRDRAVRLHAVVVSAGVHATCPTEQMSDELLDRVMNVNFAAHARLVRDILPFMVRGGRIIGVSSIAASVGIPMSAAYSASKAALELFYQSVAIELRRKSIWPVIVRPGNVNTGFNETGNELSGSGDAELAEAHRRVVDKIHSRHGMPAEDVAAAIRKAIAAPRPRFCYVVGRNAQRAAWAARLLGPDVAMMLLRRHFGLR